MANFESALAVVLENEGVFTDDPGDPGGVTKYGITLRVLLEEGIDVDGDGDIDRDDVRALSPGTSRAVYLRRWNRWGLEDIPDQRLATKVFDLAVNTGFTQCTLFVQRALVAIDLPVKVDGWVGPQTRGEFAVAASNVVLRFALLASIRSEAAGFYRHLATKSDYFRRCLAGWTRRAYQ